MKKEFLVLSKIAIITTKLQCKFGKKIYQKICLPSKIAGRICKMYCFNAEMILQTTAVLIIHCFSISSFVSAVNNGGNLRHNVATSKDVRVEDQVTSLLTSLGAIPDRVSSDGDNLQRNVITSKDINVKDKVTSLFQSSGAIRKRQRRATKPCNVDCSRVRDKPACATDRQIYRHKCELKRIRRCEGRRVRSIPMGFCTGNH